MLGLVAVDKKVGVLGGCIKRNHIVLGGIVSLVTMKTWTCQSLNLLLALLSHVGLSETLLCHGAPAT